MKWLILISIICILSNVLAICQWEGTGPICKGECKQGWTGGNTATFSYKYADGTESPSGFGADCWTGYKIYCCK